MHYSLLALTLGQEVNLTTDLHLYAIWTPVAP